MARPRTFTPEQASVRKVWSNMIARCTNDKRSDFARYGGKGVTVCSLWLDGDETIDGFGHFFNHIGPKPSNHHTLDRIDSLKGYEPGNVRWATVLEQANNKTNNRRVHYRGTEMTVAQAVRAAGSVILRETAISRLKSGWSMPQAVETPNVRPSARKAG